MWGWDFDGGSRTVDVHVQTLRQKLGEHASAIETVRGVGYRLAEPSAGDGAKGDDTAATASESTRGPSAPQGKHTLSHRVFVT